MKKKIFLILILGVFLISFASATVTFDNSQLISKVTYWDNSTSTDTSLSQSSFDIFNTSSEVGDAMTFDYGTYSAGMPWHNLYLNITTPLNATGLVLKWYYWNYYVDENYGGWSELNVNDSTNNFTQAGWINFSVPNGFMQNQIHPGYLTYPLKAEIVNLTSINSVGHVSTRPTIHDWTLRITGEENMTHLKYLNDLNNWGVIKNYSTNSYVVEANFWLGDGSTTTTFNSTNELVSIGSSNRDATMIITNYATLQLGSIDETTNSTSDGSSWVYYNRQYNYPYHLWYGTLKMYNSQFTKISKSSRDMDFRGDGYIRNSVFDVSNGPFNFRPPEGYMIDTSVNTGRQWFAYNGADYLYKNVRFTYKYAQMWNYGNNVTFTDMDFSDSAGLVFSPYCTWGGTGKDCQMVSIDCDFGNNALDSLIDPYHYGWGLIKFNLNINVVDSLGNNIPNVDLTLTDSNGSVVYSGLYNKSDILLTAFERWEIDSVRYDIDHNPYTITISKDGYSDYKTTFNLTKKTDWTIALSPPSGGGTTIVCNNIDLACSTGTRIVSSREYPYLNYKISPESDTTKGLLLNPYIIKTQ